MKASRFVALTIGIALWLPTHATRISPATSGVKLPFIRNNFQRKARNPQRICSPSAQRQTKGQIQPPGRKNSRIKTGDKAQAIQKLSEAVGGALISALFIFGTPMTSKAVQPFDMMGGMGSTNFKTTKYLGTWYEVASMKQGFAGAGQEDCHCTQGMYQLDQKRNRIIVNTFCVHGSPEGKISGIQGVVKCLDMSKMSGEEGMMREVFLEECKLRFPAIPFIPAEPYDILATDYNTYSLVQGSTDKSFVQIYSRNPKPGKAFIDQKKQMLKERGFNVDHIVDTPQDCDNKMVGKMMGEMMAKEMAKADLEKTPPVVMKAPGPKTSGPKLEGSIAFDSKEAQYLVTEVRDLAKLLVQGS